jgi:hypothetical protein
VERLILVMWLERGMIGSEHSSNLERIAGALRNPTQLSCRELFVDSQLKGGFAGNHWSEHLHVIYVRLSP